MGPLHGVQSLKPLQRGSSSCWGSPSQRDCSTMDPPWATVLARNLLFVGFLQGSSMHLLSVGARRLPLWESAPTCSLGGSRWRACSPLVSKDLAAEQYHGSKRLIARLLVNNLMCVFTCTEPQTAGNLCSSAWNTSSCSSFMGLAACRTLPYSSPAAFFTPC